MDLKDQVRKNVMAIGVEEYLRRSGVDEKTLNKSKNEFATTPGEKWYYYDQKTGKSNVLVPVSAIQGVNRMANFTWFDLLNYGAAGAPQYIRDRNDFNVNSNSFWGVLSWLENNNAEEIKSMYENTDRIQFHCFQKDGAKEYYLRGDGNHRVVTAKNLGISRIFAEDVEVYEYNEHKHRMYEEYKGKKENLFEMMKELNISFINWDQATFFMERWSGFLFKFSHKESNLIDDFTTIEVMNREIDNNIDRLNEIKRNARKYYRIYSMIPGRARNQIKKIIPDDLGDKGFSHIIALKEVDKRKGTD